MLLKNILWKIKASQVGSLGCCPKVHKFHKIAWMLVVEGKKGAGNKQNFEIGHWGNETTMKNPHNYLEGDRD